MLHPSLRADLPARKTKHLDTDVQHRAELTFSVTPNLNHVPAGTGILTRCASVTPYGLTLALD